MASYVHVGGTLCRLPVLSPFALDRFVFIFLVVCSTALRTGAIRPLEPDLYLARILWTSVALTALDFLYIFYGLAFIHPLGTFLDGHFA